MSGLRLFSLDRTATHGDVQTLPAAAAGKRARYVIDAGTSSESLGVMRRIQVDERDRDQSLIAAT